MFMLFSELVGFVRQKTGGNTNNNKTNGLTSDYQNQWEIGDVFEVRS